MRERHYRHPASERTAKLHVRPLHGSSQRRRWELRLVAGDGSMAKVAGQPAIMWLSSPGQLRLAYRERLHALRTEGWLRVA